MKSKRGSYISMQSVIKGEDAMPIINVKVVENVFSADQKRELLSKLTDVMESVYPGLRDVTFVTIEEVKEGEWGIGGQSITSKKVAEHAKKNISA